MELKRNVGLYSSLSSMASLLQVSLPPSAADQGTHSRVVQVYMSLEFLENMTPIPQATMESTQRLAEIDGSEPFANLYTRTKGDASRDMSEDKALVRQR
jgi:hypothetical protein